MSNLERAIAEWRRQMAASGVKTSESLNELEAHLRDDVEHSIRSGLSAEQAFEVAIRRLGDVGVLRGEFAKWARTKRRHFIYRGLVFGIARFRQRHPGDKSGDNKQRQHQPSAETHQ